AGANIQPPVSVPGPARERIAAPAVSESFLEAAAQIAGPLVRGGVRIPIMQDPGWAGHLPLLMPIQLFEERDEGGSVLDGNIGAVRHFLKYALVSFSTCF